MSERYPGIHELAVRLILGETVDITDEDGRHWRADATRLLIVLEGSGLCASVAEGDAFDVALKLARALS